MTVPRQRCESVRKMLLLAIVMLFPALFALTGSSAAAALFEQPAAVSHHLVWGGITLEISNDKPSATPRRYMWHRQLQL